MNWRDLLEALVKDLQDLDDVIFPDDQTDTQTDEDSDEDSDSEPVSMEEAVFNRIAEYLHFEDYNREQVHAYLSGLASILKEWDSLEFYNLGLLLIYLSERRWVANKLTDFLDEIGF